MFRSAHIKSSIMEDPFVAWHAAARDARLALEAWLAANAESRAAAYVRYRASLDREERAADVLALCSQATVAETAPSHAFLDH
jgi:hypothetical protein